MLHGLDLFSGIAGISCGLHEWVKTICYCEREPYCQAVLLSRMASGDIERAPIWDDITTFNGIQFEGHVDIISAGFPCQDISIAGKGKGLEGERSGLFFEIVRLAKEIKPKFLFLENVPAISSRGGLQVVREVAEMGYDCRWCVISAASAGALHKRERWFMLAYSQGKRQQETGQPMRPQEEFSQRDNSNKYETWDEEPENKLELVRVVNGLQDRAHRIKALGNAVVPIQVKKAFKILMGIKG